MANYKTELKKTNIKELNHEGLWIQRSINLKQIQQLKKEIDKLEKRNETILNYIINKKLKLK